jgi:hypothetical protein
MNIKIAALGVFLTVIPWGAFSQGVPTPGVSSPGTSPQSLEELLDGAKTRALKAGELISEVQQHGTQPRLVPRHSPTQQRITAILTELDPELLAECLFLYAKPEKGAWTREERSGIYNQLLALSTLEGILYFSVSHNSWRPLYDISTGIDNPQEKNPQSDPVYASPPENLTLYARQRDLTFGDNIYRYEYHAYRDSLIFIQENLTTMTFGILPAVGKNKLRSLVSVIDTGDYLLIYAASMAKTAPIPGFSQRAGASFSNRIEAILKWFCNRADRVFNG